MKFTALQQRSKNTHFMQLIDTHAHIYLPEFDADREDALKRATANGIGPVLMPAIDTATHTQMLLTETSWPACSARLATAEPTRPAPTTRMNMGGRLPRLGGGGGQGV